MRREEFDGHPVSEIFACCQEDVAHAAAGEPVQDTVRPKSFREYRRSIGGVHQSMSDVGNIDIQQGNRPAV